LAFFVDVNAACAFCVGFRYTAAQISTVDRAGMVKAVISTIERDLELLGLTGVEDRLQDDVKVTLEILRNAGLKVWMLTGDKIETAACVAVSSKLVARNQSLHMISKGVWFSFVV
jgi:phospholipid-translocating ATPase